jgi:hypothetical protein
MSNGDDSSDDRGLAPVPPGMKRYTVRNKTGDSVTVIGKIGADAERIKQKAAEEFARRASTPAAVDVPGAFVHGAVRGLAGELAPLGQAAQVEMGQVGPGFAPVPSAAETTKILEQQLPGFVPHHEARTTPGHMAERFGEFIAAPATWIGPGGFFRKGLSALTGAAGSVLGERYGGTPGAIVGGVAGGGAGGFGAGGRGLPGRVAKDVREATTEDALKAASREGYEQLKQFDQYRLSEGQNAILTRAIKNYLTEEEGTVFPEYLAPKTWRTLDDWLLKARTVADVERVRQVLNQTRIEGGNEALASSKAIEAIDDYMYELPGVKGVADAARGNWAAYKRGQIIEETIRRGIERATTSGKGGGGNIVNTIKQEFARRIRGKPDVWKRFTAEEQKQIELTIDPGRGLDVAHWLSNFSPRHPITGAIGFFGGGAATGDVLSQLAILGTGEVAHRFTKRMTQGRAERVLEATRARSPAGAEAAGLPPGQTYTPRPAVPPAARGAYGAARALGATALSPDVTDVLELPEIVVRPR